MSLSNDIVDVIQKANQKKTSAYDSVGTVTRVEDGVAWVHIAGGVDETPVQMTINAKEGDQVQVRVAGGRAWLVGNASSPPTDDTTAKQALDYGKIANDAAQKAVQDSLVASEAAGRAQRTAEAVEGIARHAEEVAESVEGIAQQASEDAGIARSAADSAMKGLGQVEDVVGTLNWITAHSKVTEDTTPTAGKSYYIKNQDGTFTLVIDVEGKDPAQEGWYELTEAVQNYILSHLALLDGGLYVMKDTSHWKVRVADNGVYVLDEDDVPINQMTNTGNVTGYASGVHTLTDQDSIEFYDGDDRLGYVGNNKLFFASAEITSNLYVTDKYVWRKTPQGAMGLYLR